VDEKMETYNRALSIDLGLFKIIPKEVAEPQFIGPYMVARRS